MKCNLCKRELDHPDDPLSESCGGDCIGCMITVEAGMGDWKGVRDHFLSILFAVHERVKKEERGED